MKGNRLCVVLALGISASVFFSGCSFSRAMEKVVDVVTDSEGSGDADTALKTEESFTVYDIDDSIAAPEFAVDLGGKSSVTKDSPVALQVIATSPDGGLISYQWYKNNVNSNGGGTVIPGAVGDTYAPETAEKGTWFYYVVAVNTRDGKANMSTSSVSEVAVWDNMYWQQNADNGGYQYICRDDGKYPCDAQMMIDGTLYSFNSEGFVTDSEGKLIDIASGQPVLTQVSDQTETDTASVAAEDTAGEETGGEETAGEEAGGEETGGEESNE